MKIVSEEKLFFGAFIANLLIFVTEIVGVVLASSEVGWRLFCYYTELSNIFLLISSGAYLVSFYANVVKGCGTNFFTHLVRFAATAATTMTFLVVVTVLIPMRVLAPLELLFGGSMLFHHTLCPLLSVFSFLFLEKEETRNMKRGHVFYALVFTALYAAVFITLNALKIYDGPYPFLRVYDQPIWASVVWFFVLMGLAYAIAYALYAGNKKIFQRGVIRG